MSLKKTIGFISALLTAATLTVSSVAYAELKENEIEVKPKVKQYDDICGSVKVSILPITDEYATPIAPTCFISKYAKAICTRLSVNVVIPSIFVLKV